MLYKHVLITGGAGFVGSNLAVHFKEAYENCRVSVLDNLKRRGSELNLPRLKSNGIEFTHGDVRNQEDLASVTDFDLLIDCAAEPSVQAGNRGGIDYVVNTNLVGTINSLEAARRANAAFILLSTSRVYPIEALNRLPYEEDSERFRWRASTTAQGLCEYGIGEDFPLDGARSFYGASKLASELLVKEFAYQYGMPAIINRCGILAGPWQMGKADQGVVTLWVARHHFRQPLKYIGFGGQGKQVRDILHVSDLFELLVQQIGAAENWTGQVYNVGGGVPVSISLAELTEHCAAITGNDVQITAQPETANTDVRIFLTDSRKVQQDFGWAPKRNVMQIVQDIHKWIGDHQSQLEPILA